MWGQGPFEMPIRNQKYNQKHNQKYIHLPIASPIIDVRPEEAELILDRDRLPRPPADADPAA